MRLLIVSPRFPPSTAADSQRVRMVLPHLAAQGCDAEVLALDPLCCADGLDPWQVEHLPSSVPIHRARGLTRRWARLPGLGSIESRCYRALAFTGSRLLSEKAFDLVYISTTAFGCFSLGPLWKRIHGTPFVLDYQDPWVNDYYHQHPEICPPGGWLKYGVVDKLNRFQEPRVLRYAAGITSVSAAYPAQLKDRYPFASSIPSLVLPFPGSEDDFRFVDEISSNSLPFDPYDGLIHWVCIGRVDTDLFRLSLSALFSAISCFAHHGLRSRLRLHFLGTSYAPDGRGIPTINHLAAQYGLANIVEESTDRLPLSVALAVLKAADALLILGSSDPGYSASKLVPYLLASRPLLVVMHEQSMVCELLDRFGGGKLVRFSNSQPIDELAISIADKWLSSNSYSQVQPLDRPALFPFTASGQSQHLVAFLQRCISA